MFTLKLDHSISSSQRVRERGVIWKAQSEIGVWCKFYGRAWGTQGSRSAGAGRQTCCIQINIAKTVQYHLTSKLRWEHILYMFYTEYVYVYVLYLCWINTNQVFTVRYLQYEIRSGRDTVYSAVRVSVDPCTMLRHLIQSGAARTTVAMDYLVNSLMWSVKRIRATVRPILSVNLIYPTFE